MKAFGYTLEQWRETPVCDRARLVAHELERGTRDGYRHALDEARRKPAPPMNGLEAIHARWGI